MPAQAADAREPRDGGGRRGGRGNRADAPAERDRAPTEDAATLQAFADTQPGLTDSDAARTAGPEAGDLREPRDGRRRRRGGRGRDRDQEAGGDHAEPRADESTDGLADAGTAAVGRADLPTVEGPAGDAPMPPSGEDGGDRPERDGRRRSRGGRNRRDRGDQPTVTTSDDAVAADADEPVDAMPVAMPAEPVMAATAVPAPVDVAPEAPLADDTAAAVAEIDPVQTLPMAEVPVAEAPVPATPVAAVEPTPAPSPAPASGRSFVLPTADLQALAETAGLTWVNSDADKIRAAQEAIAAEPKPVHTPRPPKPVVAIDEGPLVLVETRKDLAQIKLPFETGAGSQPQA